MLIGWDSLCFENAFADHIKANQTAVCDLDLESSMDEKEENNLLLSCFFLINLIYKLQIFTFSHRHLV